MEPFKCSMVSLNPSFPSVRPHLFCSCCLVDERHAVGFCSWLFSFPPPYGTLCPPFLPQLWFLPPSVPSALSRSPASVTPGGRWPYKHSAGPKQKTSLVNPQVLLRLGLGLLPPRYASCHKSGWKRRVCRRKPVKGLQGASLLLCP